MARNYSRRQTIAATGSAFIAISVAGCSGEGGNGGNGSGNNGGSSNGGGGTTGQNQNSGAEISLLTDDTNPTTREALDAAAAAYNEQSPNTIEMEYVDEQTNQVIPNRVRAGNVPDISTADTAEAGSYYEEGLLTPVDELVEGIEEDTGATFADSQLLTVDDQVYNFPWSVSPMNIHVYDDMLQQAGVDIDYSSKSSYTLSWDDFLNMVESVGTEFEGKRGIQFCTGETPKAHLEATTLGWSNGVNFYDRSNGEVEVVLDNSSNTSKMIEALEFLDQFYEYSLDGGGVSWGGSLQSFTQEQIGTVNYSPSVFQSVRDNNPDSYEQLKSVKIPRNGDVNPDWGFSIGFALYTDQKFDTNPDAAMDFLQWWWGSDYHADLQLARPFKNVPPIDGPIAEQWRENDLINEKPETAEVLLNTVSNGRFTSPSGGYNPAWGQAYAGGTCGRMTERYLLTDNDPEQIIAETADELRSFLE
jgi:ABC-type glycerol-3-phosphate transport system substrate-binding protein